MRCADSPLALLLETVDGSHSPGGLRLPSFPSRSAGGYSADIQHKEGNTENLAEKLRLLIALPSSTKREIGEKLRAIVREKHSISTLSDRLIPLLTPRI